jgi:hypothetical protein
MDEELKQALDTMEARILERIHDVETHLLRGFEGWSNAINLRLKAIPLIDERVAQLERRVTELEFGTKPPQQDNSQSQ